MSKGLEVVVVVDPELVVVAVVVVQGVLVDPELVAQRRCNRPSQQKNEHRGGEGACEGGSSEVQH